MRLFSIMLVLFLACNSSLAQVSPKQAEAGQAIRDGRFEEALQILEPLLDADPRNGYSEYLVALAMWGVREDVDDVWAHLNHAEKLGAPPQLVGLLKARVHAGSGDANEALAALGGIARTGFVQLSRVEDEPDFDGIRGEPEYQSVIQEIRANRYPCETDPRHRDFDFWIGKWDVFQNGVIAGSNDIASILGGCLIFEQWVGVNGVQGKSFNYFDPGKNHWRQIWVSDSGTVIEFTGEARDGGIFYTAETVDPGTGGITHHRFEFTQLPDNKVRQFWATSTDKKEWTTIWDGRYQAPGEG